MDIVENCVWDDCAGFSHPVTGGAASNNNRILQFILLFFFPTARSILSIPLLIGGVCVWGGGEEGS